LQNLTFQITAPLTLAKPFPTENKPFLIRNKVFLTGNTINQCPMKAIGSPRQARERTGERRTFCEKYGDDEYITERE
jgi:hypothetical protein